MNDREFESRVLRFERARQLGDPGAIVAHLAGPWAPADPERHRLLVELVCIDLEYGWRDARGGGPTTLAGYVEMFPELISLDRLPIELIGEEYRARCRWGDRPAHEDFASRFRERVEAIRDELVRIDQEMDSESAEPLRRPRSPLPRAEIPETGPATPLLSDRDFLLRRMIGVGRMGKVYEALHRVGGREVAVKFLRKSLLHHPEAVRRFLGEARTTAGLHHPHIVATEGLGRTSGGSFFIVMDLVAGPDLASVVQRGPVALDRAIRWTIETCRAMEHAHERGVIHCDLKPANLLLDADGRIRVTDFGLARSLAGEPAGASGVEGTVPFMAPEQGCSSWGPIDHRADVYGIGAVLFALLTGRPPFEGRRLPDVLAQVIGATPVVSPGTIRPGLSEPVDVLCRRCLAKAAGDRFPGVRELRIALEEAQETASSNRDGGACRPV